MEEPLLDRQLLSCDGWLASESSHLTDVAWTRWKIWSLRAWIPWVDTVDEKDKQTHVELENNDDDSQFDVFLIVFNWWNTFDDSNDVEFTMPPCFPVRDDHHDHRESAEKRQMLMSLEIPSKDYAYQWVPIPVKT